MIDWSKQHCGVHQAPFENMLLSMPDLDEILQTFPEDPYDFTWDVKVHMLMPGQFPCIPGKHVDMIPRVNGKQDFSLARYDLKMYLWVSGHPLTKFGDKLIEPQTWIPFTQADEHEGTCSEQFTWRGFIRAVPHEILKPKKVKSFTEYLRRHTQVYLDAEKFKW